MNLLMIGGTGCLSTAVTAEALRKGINVTMMNRGNRKIPDGVELLKCDFKDSKVVDRLLEGRRFDAVIDFISYTERDLVYSYRTLCRHVDQYVFISSCAVYGPRVDDKTGPRTEEEPRGNINWWYSLGKYACETVLEDLFKVHGCQYTIVRPAVTYGDTRIPYGIVPPYGMHWTLIGRALAGKPIITWNNAENGGNMMHVDDFAVGLLGLIGNKAAYGEAFNICGDERPTYNDVLSAISEAIGKNVLTIDIDRDFYGSELGDEKGQELRNSRSGRGNCSNEKIKKYVPEFKCSISINAGIKRTIEAYKNQNYQNGIDWAFDANTDRIILKWCKFKGIDPKPFNIRFVDYLGSATFRDKYTYWSIVHSGEKACRIFRFALRTLRCLKQAIIAII